MLPPPVGLLVPQGRKANNCFFSDPLQCWLWTQFRFGLLRTLAQSSEGKSQVGTTSLLFLNTGATEDVSGCAVTLARPVSILTSEPSVGQEYLLGGRASVSAGAF